MIIQSLHISNLRNIASAEISPSPGTNIIYGDNGSGKSTFLESIYLLARARSFRPGSSKSPISSGQDKLNIFATALGMHQRLFKIGLERTYTDLSLRVNGESIKKLSLLAEILPISLITPQSYRIIEEGPEYRRKLLNWGVFHVEPSFNSVMMEYTKSTVQRNKALHLSSNELRVWDLTYVEHALKVSSHQEAYFEHLHRAFFEITRDIPFLADIELTFYKGWPHKEELSEVVTKMREQDRERGFTYAGPHRSDIIIKVNGQPARNQLSRGQMKILFSAIALAQARITQERRGEAPIILFDDLSSELDDQSVGLISQLLNQLNAQLFITTVDPSRLTQGGWLRNPGMFHVEHGRFLS